MLAPPCSSWPPARCFSRPTVRPRLVVVVVSGLLAAQGETNNEMLHEMFKVCGSCAKRPLKRFNFHQSALSLGVYTHHLETQPAVPPLPLRKDFALGGAYAHNHFSATCEFLNAKGGACFQCVDVLPRVSSWPPASQFPSLMLQSGDLAINSLNPRVARRINGNCKLTQRCLMLARSSNWKPSIHRRGLYSRFWRKQLALTIHDDFMHMHSDRHKAATKVLKRPPKGVMVSRHEGPALFQL